MPSPPVSSSQVAAKRSRPRGRAAAPSGRPRASRPPTPWRRSRRGRSGAPPRERGVHGSALHPSTGGTVSRWELRSRRGRSSPRVRQDVAAGAARPARRPPRRSGDAVGRGGPSFPGDARDGDELREPVRRFPPRGRSALPVTRRPPSMPLPRSPKISERRAFLWLPLTMWTARTPGLGDARDLSRAWRPCRR